MAWNDRLKAKLNEAEAQRMQRMSEWFSNWQAHSPQQFPNAPANGMLNIPAAGFMQFFRGVFGRGNTQ